MIMPMDQKKRRGQRIRGRDWTEAPRRSKVPRKQGGDLNPPEGKGL